MGGRGKVEFTKEPEREALDARQIGCFESQYYLGKRHDQFTLIRVNMIAWEYRLVMSRCPKNCQGYFYEIRVLDS